MTARLGLLRGVLGPAALRLGHKPGPAPIAQPGGDRRRRRIALLWLHRREPPPRPKIPPPGLSRWQRRPRAAWGLPGGTDHCGRPQVRTGPKLSRPGVPRGDPQTKEGLRGGGRLAQRPRPGFTVLTSPSPEPAGAAGAAPPARLCAPTPAPRPPHPRVRPAPPGERAAALEGAREVA